MRPQPRSCINRQFEPAALNQIRLRRHLRHQTDEPRRRFFDSEAGPGACEKEKHDARTIKRRPFVRPRSNVQIKSQYRPTSLVTESHNPFDVRSIGREFVAQRHDIVLAGVQGIQRFCDARSKIVVE